MLNVDTAIRTEVDKANKRVAKSVSQPKPTDTPPSEPSEPVAPSNPFEGITPSKPTEPAQRAQRGSNEARALMAILRFPWGPHLKDDTLENRMELAEALIKHLKSANLL